MILKQLGTVVFHKLYSNRSKMCFCLEIFSAADLESYLQQQDGECGIYSESATLAQ